MLDKVRPASLKAMTGRRNSGMRFGSLPVNTEKNCLRLAVHAELHGSDTACACGITGRGNAPVLDLCRQLLESGHDPDQPLEAYRGDILCLTIRSIREAAGLEINSAGTGFVRHRGLRRGSPMRQNGGGHG